MINSRTSHRVKAIVIALVVTFGANAAISYAAKPDAKSSSTSQSWSSHNESRSGNQLTPAPPIKPISERSGNQTTPPPPPK